MNEPRDTLATLLAWKDIGPGRRVTVCRRCGASIELRLMDDLLAVACPGCGASPFFEAVRDLELEAGWERARAALEGLGVLWPHESEAALLAAGTPPAADPDDARSGFVGAARALGFFRKSLYLSIDHERGGALVLRPLDVLVGPEQLAEAIELELAEGTPSGEVIGRLVLAAEKDKLYALMDADAIEHVDLDRLEIEPSAKELMPAALAASDLVVPIRLEGERLVVAMRDPLDYEQIDRVKFLLGREVRAVAAAEDALLRALERLFPEDVLQGEAPPELLFGEEAGELALLEGGAAPNEPSAEALEAAGMPEARPGERMFEQLVARLLDDEAETLLIEPLEITSRVRLARGARLRDIALLEQDAAQALFRHIAERAGVEIEGERVPAALGRIEAQLHGERVELEAAFAPAVFGPFVVLTLAGSRFRSLTLGALALLPHDAEALRRLSRLEPGFVIVTGPRGADRSTLLYALFREADRAREQIMVLERSPRARVEGVTQLAASDWTSFAPVLDRARGRRLFCDDLFAVPGAATTPNELRLLVEQALGGANVTLSVPAGDAIGAVARLVSAGLSPVLVRRLVRAVIDVRFVRRLCPRCGKEFEADAATRARLGLPDEVSRLHVGIGCGECGGRGYRGRAALIELLPSGAVGAVAQALAALDRKALERACAEHGVARLRTKALRALRAGLTPIAEVRSLL